MALRTPLGRCGFIENENANPKPPWRRKARKAPGRGPMRPSPSTAKFSPRHQAAAFFFFLRACVSFPAIRRAFFFFFFSFYLPSAIDRQSDARDLGPAQRQVPARKWHGRTETSCSRCPVVRGTFAIQEFRAAGQQPQYPALSKTPPPICDSAPCSRFQERTEGARPETRTVYANNNRQRPAQIFRR